MKTPLVSPSRRQPFMKTTAFGNAAFALAVLGAFASPALGASVTYVAGPSLSDTNGSSSIGPGTTYTTNLGYAFKTGSSGTFDIDWIKLELTSGASSGSGSFKISLHNTNNAIAYSAVAGSTVHAADTVSFTTPSTANTPFELTLTSADLDNISAYSLVADTVYSLFVNSLSDGSSLALRRKQGLANGTTNDAYTVTNGFTMLDTFRNNTPNYANSPVPPVSYAAFAISFGGEVSAVPETSNMAFLAVLVGSGLVRRHRARR
jgi:hypothetical protein